MSMSPKAIRDLLEFERTPQDKGWSINLKISAYDTGILSINGTPMSHHFGDRTYGNPIAEANSIVALCLEEFVKFLDRQKANGAETELAEDEHPTA